MTVTPIVIDTTSAPRFDFTVRNNADWLQPFAFYSAYSPTPPWSNVDTWQPSQFYQSVLPATIVTYLGDLYAPSVTAPETWSSATTFAAEASNWTRIGIANTWSSAAYDLTGCSMSMGIVQLDSSGVNNAAPKQKVIAVPVNIGSPPSAGQVALGLLAASAAIVPAGVYGYDMNIINGAATITALWGLVTVLQGAT